MEAPLNTDGTEPPLTRQQERSLWLHRAVLTQLLSDPAVVLSSARANLQRWQALHRADGMTVRYLTCWAEILDQGVDVVGEMLISRAPDALELRRNSPFAGVLPEEVRRRMLQAFNAHWDQYHQAHDLAEAAGVEPVRCARTPS